MTTVIYHKNKLYADRRVTVNFPDYLSHLQPACLGCGGNHFGTEFGNKIDLKFRDAKFNGSKIIAAGHSWEGVTRGLVCYLLSQEVDLRTYFTSLDILGVKIENNALQSRSIVITEDTVWTVKVFGTNIDIVDVGKTDKTSIVIGSGESFARYALNELNLAPVDAIRYASLHDKLTCSAVSEFNHKQKEPKNLKQHPAVPKEELMRKYFNSKIVKMRRK